MKDYTLPLYDATVSALNESARRQGLDQDVLLLSIVQNYLSPLMNELAVIREAKRLDTYEKADPKATVEEVKAMIASQEADDALVEGETAVPVAATLKRAVAPPVVQSQKRRKR